MSFWAILILILLPKPAKYGSDVLSDWPSLFFYTAGLLLLFKGAVNKKWWMFGLAGLAGGAGYLIRPECAMVAVLGALWIALQLLWPKYAMSRSKSLAAFGLLIIGFLAIAGPYMHLKGALFPKKNVGQFVQSPPQQKVPVESKMIAPQQIHTSQFTPLNIAHALRKLVRNTSETLMWIFVPALLIGMYKWFKKHKWHEPEKFFIISIIFLNVPLMVWLYCKHGYIDDRHTLPLLILPILYVPVGLCELAVWFRERFSRKPMTSAAENRDERRWFGILLLIGIAVCTPKLFKPLRIEKQGYRAAAQWLKTNTDISATVAVPDERIGFYAQRQGLEYENGNIPANAVYIVKIFKSKKNETPLAASAGKVEYEYIDEKKRGVDVIIYRNL